MSLMLKLRSHLVRAVALVALVVVSLPPLAAQAPDEPEPLVRKREMPGRGIKGAGFAGVAPAEAEAAARLLERGIELQERGSHRSALGAFKRVYKKYPRSASAPEAYYRSSRIHLERDDPIKAFEAIDAIVRAYPNFGRFNELISEEYRIAYELVSGKRLKMFGVLPGFSNEDRGLFFFERLIFNAPFSDFAPLALMNIANAHARAGRTDEAINALDRLITNYPGSMVTPEAYLNMARVHEQSVDGPLYDQSATREAINHFEDYLILFPRSPNVASAEEGLARMRDMLAESRLRIADFYYFKRARYQAAKVFYNEAITLAPTSPTAGIARERIARVELDEAKWEAQLAARAEREQERVDRRAPAAPPPAAEPTGPGTIEVR